MSSFVPFLDFSQETLLRMNKVRAEMSQRQIDACLISTPVNTLYLLERIVNGYLLIFSEDPLPRLFIRRPAGLQGERVHYIRRPEEIYDWFVTTGHATPSRLGLEIDALAYSDITRVQKVFPNAEICNADLLLRTSRAIKTQEEIFRMRDCGKQYCEAFKCVPDLYRRGMSDYEFSLAFERLLREMGHIGIFRTFGAKMEGFMGTSILVGDNADNGSPYDFALGGAGMTPALPMAANGTVLCEGQTMMVDGGGCFGPYITDMTRVFALGTLPDLALKAHECSIEICHQFEEKARPGASCADLYLDALKLVDRAGLIPYFMGYSQQAAFVGHGVGLQINELPVLFARSKDVIEEGMTIAVEPKFVIPGVGAVGIENTYLIASSGTENLTGYVTEEIVYL